MNEFKITGTLSKEKLEEYLGEEITGYDEKVTIDNGKVVGVSISYMPIKTIKEIYINFL